MTAWAERLGSIGVWRSIDLVDAELATGIEHLGYGAIWLGGSPTSDLRGPQRLLESTATIRIATGVVNIWNSDAAELAASFHRVEALFPGRLLLGIGSGHREATPERARPIDAMNEFLDVLDEHDVPLERRVLSAMGPRMVTVAAERSAGTHPYLTIPSQTAEARATLGASALVAPEQTVALSMDVESARSTGRAFLRTYLGLQNYLSTMRRGGFSEEDIAAGGSDRLVDSIVRHGDAGTIARAAREHLDAGADHVCLQVLPTTENPLQALQQVADMLDLRQH
jgi:probable F420-dependent oxidoreductase